MAVPSCEKCRKSMALVKRWSQCTKCGVWLCPSCTLRYCLYCKGEMADRPVPAL